MKNKLEVPQELANTLMKIAADKSQTISDTLHNYFLLVEAINDPVESAKRVFS